MAKLPSRTALTSLADGDLLHTVDISDTTADVNGTSKKITASNVATYVNGKIVGTDQLVKVSSNDTTADYLLNKIAVDSTLTKTETNDGGNETVTLGVDADYGGSLTAMTTYDTANDSLLINDASASETKQDSIDDFITNANITTASSAYGTDNVLIKSDGTSKANQATGITVTDSDEISGYLGNINVQTGTTYTLVASDAGKVITLNNASAITVTAPNSLSVGFTCTLIQLGAGQVTVAAGASATVSNRQSHTKIAGQNGMATLAVVANSGGSAASYIFGGDTAS